MHHYKTNQNGPCFVWYIHEEGSMNVYYVEPSCQSQASNSHVSKDSSTWIWLSNHRLTTLVDQSWKMKTMWLFHLYQAAVVWLLHVMCPVMWLLDMRTIQCRCWNNILWGPALLLIYVFLELDLNPCVNVYSIARCLDCSFLTLLTSSLHHSVCIYMRCYFYSPGAKELLSKMSRL